MWLSICLLLAAVCCILIAIQDFRDREIHILPLLLFGISGLVYQGSILKEDIWYWLLANATMVSMILLVVLLVFRLRGTSRVMDVKLGWGDVLMFIALCPWLDPFQYIFLYAGTTLILTIVFGLLRWTNSIKEGYPIPLAGYLAVAFFFYFPIQWI